jgi:hypothetical protein
MVAQAEEGWYGRADAQYSFDENWIMIQSIRT